MKVANNMDTVFAGYTQDELEFETMFDTDDCLIDLVAGVKEDGSLVTGNNPEDMYEFQLDENGDPLTDEDAEDLRDGSKKYAGDPAEGTKKDADAEFDSVEGMKSAVPGTGNSEESHAHDVTKEIEDAIKESDDVCPSCGKKAGECTCKEGCAKEGCSKEGCEKESCTKEEKCNEDLDFELEFAEFIIDEEVNTSSQTDDTFESKIKGEDMLTDKESDDLRDGSAKYAGDPAEGTKKNADAEFDSVEGMKSAVPGTGNSEESHAHDVTKEIEDAIKEDIEFELEMMLAEADDEDGKLDSQISKSDGLDNATIPDCVQTDGSSNDIPTDAETQSSDGVNPATEDVVYTGWRKVTEAESKVPMTSDDSDIESVKKGDYDTEGEVSLDVDYDDDALIDMAIAGDFDL